MVKKLQKMAEKQAASPAGLLDGQLAQTIRDSAQQIWLAGLGAFAKAQGGGGTVFETLIKEGVSLQRKTQAAAEEKLGGVAGKMTAMAGEVGQQANKHWDKLETIFEERTARALGKLGVPTARELAALAARVAALEAALAKPAKAATVAARAEPAPRPAAKKAARKTAAKPAPAAAAKAAPQAAASEPAGSAPAPRRRGARAL